MADIKESKEAIEALKLAAKITKKVIKGGLPSVPQAVLEAAGNSKVFLDGYKDADKIGEELKDLQKEEIIALFVSVFDAVKEVEQV